MTRTTVPPKSTATIPATRITASGLRQNAPGVAAVTVAVAGAVAAGTDGWPVPVAAVRPFEELVPVAAVRPLEELVPDLAVWTVAPRMWRPAVPWDSTTGEEPPAGAEGDPDAGDGVDGEDDADPDDELGAGAVGGSEAR